MVTEKGSDELLKEVADPFQIEERVYLDDDKRAAEEAAVDAAPEADDPGEDYPQGD